MAVLSGALLSGEAAKTRARTSGEAYFLFVNGRYNFNSPIGNQAFSPDGCNIFPGLSYNKANNTFLNSLRN